MLFEADRGAPARTHARRVAGLLVTAGVVLCVVVAGAACGPFAGDGTSAVAVPTPERNDLALLPETPPDSEASTVAPTVVATTAPLSMTPADATTDDEMALAAGGADVMADAPPALDCLTPRARYAQLLLPLLTQAELGRAEQLAAAGDLGGLGLLGSPDAGLGDALARVQNATLFAPVLVASDEEGGVVQRLAALLGPLPSAAQTATMSSPDEVRAQWLEYGSRLKALGIDAVFGPVVDVGGAPGIESRSFGDDPAVVTAYAGAVADGLADAGVLVVFKHFPGHGRASGDSHLGLPLTPPIEDLRRLDLLPYVELIGANQRDEAAVMIGHLSVPGLSGDRPTSLSEATIASLLKTEIGFDGLVLTDALNMGAIQNGFGTLEATELALRAGADIAILGSLDDVAPVLDHLVAVAAADPAFAELLDNRVRRVLRSKGALELCAGAR